MAANEVELVLDVKADLGEGPSWDAEKRLLYWVNIMAGEVHIYDPAQGTDRTIAVGSPVGAVVPGKGNLVYVVTQQGYHSLDIETEKLTLIADPEPELANNRFNDGKCDPEGRYWAGTMSLTGEQGTGSFYCLDPKTGVRKLFSDVSCSNGIAWSPDYRTMYYIDSPTLQVVAFDYDRATGSISGKRVVVQLGEGEGVPDGMTSDAAGNLWVAQWGGYQVSHWNPATGEKLGSIAMPAANASSCCFGGDDLRDLYITSARTDNSEDVLAKYPHSGGLFRIRLDVPGLPTHRYGG